MLRKCNHVLSSTCSTDWADMLGSAQVSRRRLWAAGMQDMEQKGPLSRGMGSALHPWGQHLWDKEDVAVKIVPSGKCSTQYRCSHPAVTKVRHCFCRLGQCLSCCTMQKNLPLGDGLSHVIVFWWSVPYPRLWCSPLGICVLSLKHPCVSANRTGCCRHGTGGGQWAAAWCSSWFCAVLV